MSRLKWGERRGEPPPGSLGAVGFLGVPDRRPAEALGQVSLGFWLLVLSLDCKSCRGGRRGGGQGPAGTAGSALTHLHPRREALSLDLLWGCSSSELRDLPGFASP